MATGDAGDMLARIRSNLPPWFPQQGSAPVIDGVLTASASTFAFVYGLYQYTALQTRRLTATDAWLDLIGWDYLGGRVVRRLTESDTNWRIRLGLEILRERATRNGMIQALLDLTGIAPVVFEPSLPLNVGGYSQAGLLGYNESGAYGSLLRPWQADVTAFRPSQSGIPNVSGYSSPPGGYSQASQLCWNDISQVIGLVTDADINAAIEAVRPVVTMITIGISNLVTLVPLTDESGNALTDEAGNQLYQD